MDEQTLIKKLQEQIIESLSLEDLTPGDIDPDTPLFVEGLGLDSIDALELILLMQKHYDIKIEDSKERRSVLQSVRSMAKYIISHQ